MAKFRGTVVRSDLEGGFWTLQADDGETYKLEGPDGESGEWPRMAGKRAEVDGAVDDAAMGIGFGAQVLRVKKCKIL
jgi:hypothetical protein